MNSRQFLAAGALVVLANIAGVVAMERGRPGVAQIEHPVAPTAESVVAGKQIYLRRCASCHGASAEGGPGNDLIPAAPSLVDDQWDHGSTDREIFANIKNGVAPDFNMVPFKDTLKDDEIWNVVNYLRSIAKK